MPRLVKLVRNLHRVEFDTGSFDDWCVYLHLNGKARYAPADTTYFEFFRQKGIQYGVERVYKDFVQIYTPTSCTIDPFVLDLITKIADTYGTDAEEMDIWYSVIYGGMIAEENKKNAVLKKRIKRLGMYQVLMQEVEPNLAANFSKGKKIAELIPVLQSAGI